MRLTTYEYRLNSAKRDALWQQIGDYQRNPTWTDDARDDRQAIIHECQGKRPAQVVFSLVIVSVALGAGIALGIAAAIVQFTSWLN